MVARSWIATFLLINYLLVAGLGCISRPEDERELVLVQTNVGGPYLECRYLRMDGLEDFLNEALASRYQNAPDPPQHHLLSLVPGIDAHYLPALVCPLLTPANQDIVAPSVSQSSAILPGVSRAVYLPPRLG